MEKIVNLSKRRGFVFQNSEIYGGLASSYEYGPLGVELKNNLKKLWWKMFVQERADMVGIDGNILQSPKVWEASGHVEKFKDPLVECKKCHKRFRSDKLADPSKCPECSGPFTEEKYFSGMFKTVIGPVEKEGLVTYLRPETAQAIFVDYKNVLSSTNKRIPFGIAQIGKAFRNEITTGNFIFRTYEFEQMEIEYFISPNENWKKIFDNFLNQMHKFGELVGLDKEKYFDHNIPDGERAHYSKKTIDIEYDWLFGRDELWGLAYRTDFDLINHQKASGIDMAYTDPMNNEKYVPHVIEPSMGLDRTVLAVLSECYDEEEVGGELRTVLRLPKAIAPIKIAILPLSKKEELISKSKEVYDLLKSDYMCEYDETQSIGKRYRRQDEIGTPYCVTVDFDSLEDKKVTVRDRDTMKQDRVEISKLAEYFVEKL
ncbi:glycine--tRNA ligase [bacterium (Candidatus Howlettbacteria) CG_4_10_14_0_8_um_filter_40_9]|nr:MAG: glycine--tRNA ligase [bacterium (Candidatus Howlettbacteria) CG_4_10_14_0_8_um_filter_40_9]